MSRWGRQQASRPCVLLVAAVASGGFVAPAHADLFERNWALRGTATQSSTAPDGEAQRAVDGSRASTSEAQTQEEDQPYWQIDLGASYRIDEIRIYKGTACCQDWLRDFAVFYLDTDDGLGLRDFNSTTTQAHVNLVPVFVPSGIFDRATGTTSPGHRAVLGGERARFIRIQLAGRGVLSLAEVEVVGRYEIAGPHALADAVSWQKTPVAVRDAATLATNGDKLLLFWTGAAAGPLRVSVDLEDGGTAVAGSPLLADVPPGAAWDSGTGHLYVSSIAAGRGRLRTLWVLDAEIASGELAKPGWQSIGLGSGAPVLVTACGRLVAAWRSGPTLMSAWRPLPPGSTWTSPQHVGAAASAPSIAANAGGDVALAYLDGQGGVVVQTAKCSGADPAWSPQSPPAGRFSGGKVSLAAYGGLFAVAALGADGHGLYSTQQPIAGSAWTGFEAIDVAGPPLAESPALFVFSGITVAVTRGVDQTLRYWVRTPNTVAARDGWIGGQKIAPEGGGSLRPMLAEVGSSRVTGVGGSPSDLYIATRGVNDRSIYALNLGRFVAREVVTHVFGVRIVDDDRELERSRWGDIANLTNLFEHMVALLSLPREAWVAVASKQCGDLHQPTHVVIPAALGGTAHPEMCPMYVWQGGSRSAGVALPTGGLMHEWMHLDVAQRGIASWPGFAEAFRFSDTDSTPAASGLTACRSRRQCGGDPCERAGDNHGGTAESTLEFKAEETTLRRWDEVSVCVSALDGTAGRRYQGGYAWYDLGTLDHAFIHTAVGYRWYGDELREMASADSSRGNSQLQRRYDWVRDHYFGGVEYNGRRSGTLPQTNRSLGYFGMPSQ